VPAIFVPAVLIVAVLTALAWFNVGPEPQGQLYAGHDADRADYRLSCALGLATPISDHGRGRQSGRIRHPDPPMARPLQRVGQLTTVVLDKTGTVTRGRLPSPPVIARPGSAKTRFSAGRPDLEAGSEHPLAQDAYLDAARERGSGPSCRGAVQCHRRAWRERVPSTVSIAGRQSPVTGEAGHNTETAPGGGGATGGHGKRRSFVGGWMGQAAGIVAVADPLKPDSVAAIRRLRDWVESGVADRRSRAPPLTAIAAQAGMTEVYAEYCRPIRPALLPNCRPRGEVVGMAGDGVNDAPALGSGGRWMHGHGGGTDRGD